MVGLDDQFPKLALAQSVGERQPQQQALEPPPTPTPGEPVSPAASTSGSLHPLLAGATWQACQRWPVVVDAEHLEPAVEFRATAGAEPVRVDRLYVARPAVR